MVALKHIAKILFYLLLITSCKNKSNKKTTLSNISKDSIIINLENNENHLELSINMLIDVFGKNVKFQNLSKRTFSFYNSKNWIFSYIVQEKSLYISSNCCFFNKTPDNFKLVKKSEWLEHKLIHKDYYYKTDKYIVVYDYLNYTNINTSNGDCPNYDRKKDILEKIRIFKIEDYFEILNNRAKF